MSQQKRIFRIFYTNQGKSYEIYARRVEQADLYGFVVIEELVFGEKSEFVVDPNEEALKNEFSDVKRLMIPYHSVSRIDEVEKEGRAKVIALASSNGDNTDRVQIPPFKKGD